jgi:PilZ domain-containing protein
MTELTQRRHRIRTSIPLRVRGMSSQQKFFDEPAATILISEHEVMTRLSVPVDLETEIHITSLNTNVPGVYRVIWAHTTPTEGHYDVGLELVESERSLWDTEFPAPAEAGQENLTQAWLVCRRCGQKTFAALPETEEEFLRAGFIVARPCDQCKATTSWEYSPETAAMEEKAAAARKQGMNLRGKGRIPMQVRIKVIRKWFGQALEDVCETENVSRTGAFFYTQQNYQAGEMLEVILPFKQGDVAIPVPARVVRVGSPDQHNNRGVAIHLELPEG